MPSHSKAHGSEVCSCAQCINALRADTKQSRVGFVVPVALFLPRASGKRGRVSVLHCHCHCHSGAGGRHDSGECEHTPLNLAPNMGSRWGSPWWSCDQGLALCVPIFKQTSFSKPRQQVGGIGYVVVVTTTRAEKVAFAFATGVPGGCDSEQGDCNSAVAGGPVGCRSVNHFSRLTLLLIYLLSKLRAQR